MKRVAGGNAQPATHFMKPTYLQIQRACVLLLLALILAGCGSSKDQYFRLSADGPALLGSSGIAVGVGPVTLPAYIDRSELVFMTSANEMQVPSKVYWAGTLQDNFVRTLATDVGRRLGSANVVPFPWGANVKQRYQVVVDVRQFHAVSGGEAVLEVAWRVQSPEDQQVLRRQNASFHEKIVGDGYEPVVAAESKLVEELAEAISRSLPARR